MPIYEYHCKACGHQFEQIQKVSDSPLVLCPDCSENAVEKLISAPSFKLAGTGWYETDFKNKKKPEEAPKKSVAADKTAVKKEDKPKATSDKKDSTN